MFARNKFPVVAMLLLYVMRQFFWRNGNAVNFTKKRVFYRVVIFTLVLRGNEVWGRRAAAVDMAFDATWRPGHRATAVLARLSTANQSFILI